jgi:hypothetical protein
VGPYRSSLLRKLSYVVATSYSDNSHSRNVRVRLHAGTASVWTASSPPPKVPWGGPEPSRRRIWMTRSDIDGARHDENDC